ncbi:DUF2796 domain-containing protein [Endozoicomonas sp. Mp262]|uniref:DUF2796 domain-containing protein n=1 Tax=Endozoicomonas sp. Mp262 TaxID=2919499 RepID=UPI0021DB70C9
MRYSPALIAGALSLALILPNTHAEQRHHEAHVHGQGQLNLAIDDSQVYMELKLPAHDLLGFESINNKAQQQALDQALLQLKSPSLWSFPQQAQCLLTVADASSNKHQHDDHEDHHSEHHHDSHHSDHHDDEHHDPHHDSHQADSDSSHMDISATYTFKCNNTKAINALSTNLFKQFERSELIKVQAITGNGQYSKTLSRTAPKVTF